MNATYGYDSKGKSLAPKKAKRGGLRGKAMPAMKYRSKREHLGTITPGNAIA